MKSKSHLVYTASDDVHYYTYMYLCLYIKYKYTDYICGPGKPEPLFQASMLEVQLRLTSGRIRRFKYDPAWTVGEFLLERGHQNKILCSDNICHSDEELMDNIIEESDLNLKYSTLS